MTSLRFQIHLLFFVLAASYFAPSLRASPAQAGSANPCPQPAPGSVISEPEDLRSQNGALEVDFNYRNFLDANGQMRYCYLYKDGSQAPNLRLHPGDWLILRLRNELQIPTGAMHHDYAAMQRTAKHDSCGGGVMDPWETNLHFHGLTVPPVCHQDDVLRTLIPPGGPPFEYRFQIPWDEPPGLYWYHPHVHGLSSAQVQGGASGALIIEGIERANRQLGGLPERVLIVRDQALLHPDAPPSTSSTVPASPVLRDSEGDILNTGTGGGKPARDLSINFVPVPYPAYTPAIIPMRPQERQFWRVLNASAITYINLEVLFDGKVQPLAVVALDGIPVNESDPAVNRILWKSNLVVPPGARVEFVLKGPSEGAHAELITRTVDTGPDGENDPDRPLATIVAKSDAGEPRSALPPSPQDPMPQRSAWLGNLKPAHERKLYFSEKPSDPNNPNSPTVFFITVDGQEPAPYDPNSTVPDITVHQGDVEDWTIENRSRELHAFHIHQLHFMLLAWNGVPVDEPFLLDTVNVSYWSGIGPYPSVKLRLDFRDPHTVGTFVYHCHLLEHEDGGMMGTIFVMPAPRKP